jgi:hypothetical protein
LDRMGRRFWIENPIKKANLATMMLLRVHVAIATFSIPIGTDTLLVVGLLYPALYSLPLSFLDTLSSKLNYQKQSQTESIVSKFKVFFSQ